MSYVCRARVGVRHVSDKATRRVNGVSELHSVECVFSLYKHKRKFGYESIENFLQAQNQ